MDFVQSDVTFKGYMFPPLQTVSIGTCNIGGQSPFFPWKDQLSVILGFH